MSDCTKCTHSSISTCTLYIIVLILLVPTGALFAKVGSGDWNYFAFLYKPPDTSVEYVVDCSVANVMLHPNGTLWGVIAYTAVLVDGVYQMAPVLILFDSYPYIAQRMGQRLRLLVAWNGFWPDVQMPTFRFIEVVRSIE